MLIELVLEGRVCLDLHKDFYVKYDTKMSVYYGTMYVDEHHSQGQHTVGWPDYFSN